MNKSQAFSWSRLILNQPIKNPTKAPLRFSRKISTSPHFPTSHAPKPSFSFSGKTHYSTVSSRAAQDLLAEVEREKQREREQRKRAGLDTKDIDQEDEEDYLGVIPLIEKLDKEKLKGDTGDLNLYEEPTDSDSDEDDERFTPDAVKKRFDEFQKKFTRHEELLKNFTEAGIQYSFFFFCLFLWLGGLFLFIIIDIAWLDGSQLWVKNMRTQIFLITIFRFRVKHDALFYFFLF